MNVIGLFNAGIDTLLSGSTVLTTQLGGTAVYYQAADDDAAMPYVIWNWQSFMDENQTPSRMFNNILNVRTFASSPAQASAIDGTIDGLLNGHTVSIAGLSNFWTSRTDAFGDDYKEPNGERVCVAGGLYRIRVGQ